MYYNAKNNWRVYALTTFIPMCIGREVDHVWPWSYTISASVDQYSQRCIGGKYSTVMMYFASLSTTMQFQNDSVCLLALIAHINTLPIIITRFMILLILCRWVVLFVIFLLDSSRIQALICTDARRSQWWSHKEWYPDRCTILLQSPSISPQAEEAYDWVVENMRRVTYTFPTPIPINCCSIIAYLIFKSRFKRLSVQSSFILSCYHGLLLCMKNITLNFFRWYGCMRTFV